MADILVQFHATSEELMSFIEGCAKEFGVYAVAIHCGPSFSARRIDLASDHIDRNEPPDRAALSVEPPDMSARSAYAFSVRNPNCLEFDIGR